MSDTSANKSSAPELPLVPEEALRLLGFCRRSGRVVIGASQVLAAVTGKKPPLIVIVAADASDRTKKQLRDKCSYRGVPVAASRKDGGELARLLGKDGTVMAAGATDAALGGQMIRLTFEDGKE